MTKDHFLEYAELLRDYMANMNGTRTLDLHRLSDLTSEYLTISYDLWLVVDPALDVFVKGQIRNRAPLQKAAELLTGESHVSNEPFEDWPYKGKSRENGIPRHGVYVRSRKNHYDKLVYNNGHLMTDYRYIPYMDWKFSHPMVNNENLHFCGGWHLWGWDNSDEALVQRVIDGKKPYGIGLVSKHYTLPPFDKEKLTVRFKDAPAHPKKHLIIICWDQTYGELFDLEALADDYKKAGLADAEEILQSHDKRLADFVLDPNSCNWETGLILGYPIDSTISRYIDS